MSTALDVVAILLKQGVLSEEQAEKVRRASRLGTVSAEQAVMQLGLRERGADRAGARRARPALPYVKINPLDLDLDVVTKGVSGPVRAQARPGRHLQDRRPASPSPSTIPSRRSRPTTSSASPASTSTRVVATPQRRRDASTSGFYDLQDQPEDRGEAAHREPPRHRRPRQPGVPVRRSRRSSTRRRRRWSRRSTTS